MPRDVGGTGGEWMTGSAGSTGRSIRYGSRPMTPACHYLHCILLLTLISQL